MQAYTMPILTATILFPILAFIAVLPYVIVQYRKYGSVSRFKTLILFSFGYYLLCAYFLVILPLPPIEEVAEYTIDFYILQPFQVVTLFFRETVLRPSDTSTYIPALTQNVFLQPFFNLLLTVPFGIYLSYLFKINWKQAILAGFSLSLFFELTQLSGLYFIYPRPYRVFEVDDLILNTAGTWLGFVIEPLITRFMPSVEKLNAEATADRERVHFARRLVAYIIDWFLFNLAFDLLAILSPTLNSAELRLLPYLMGVFLYFVMIPYFLKGATPGKHTVKIRMVTASNESRLGLRALIWRQFLLFVFMIGNTRFFLTNILTAIENYKGSGIEVYLGALIFSGLLGLYFLVEIGLLMFGFSSRMFYERASNSKEVGY